MNTRELLKLTAAGIMGGVVAIIGSRLMMPSPCCPAESVCVKDAQLLDTGYQMKTNCAKSADAYVGEGTPLELSIPTRAVSNGMDAFLYWRPAKFSADGRLISIGKETGSICFHVSGGDSFESKEARERRRADRLKRLEEGYQQSQNSRKKKGDTHESRPLLQRRKKTPAGQTAP